MKSTHNDPEGRRESHDTHRYEPKDDRELKFAQGGESFVSDEGAGYAVEEKNRNRRKKVSQCRDDTIQ